MSDWWNVNMVSMIVVWYWLVVVYPIEQLGIFYQAGINLPNSAYQTEFRISLMKVLSSRIPAYCLVDPDPCGFDIYERVSQKIKDHFLAITDTVLFEYSAISQAVVFEKIVWQSDVNLTVISKTTVKSPKTPLKLAYRIGSYQMDHEDDLVSPNLKLFGVLPSQFKAKFWRRLVQRSPLSMDMFGHW